MHTVSTPTGVIERVRMVNTDPGSLQALSMVQLDAAIDSIEAEEDAFKEATKLKEGDEMKEVNALLERHELEKIKRRNDLTEIHEKKEALKVARMQIASAPPVPAPPLIPECPVCYDELRPPRQIFTCGTGHLICSDCRPDVAGDMCVQRCGTKYAGRATAMEQMVRQILGIM
jgi:hypothetical protein